MWHLNVYIIYKMYRADCYLKHFKLLYFILTVYFVLGSVLTLTSRILFQKFPFQNTKYVILDTTHALKFEIQNIKSSNIKILNFSICLYSENVTTFCTWIRVLDTYSIIKYKYTNTESCILIIVISDIKLHE